MNVFSVRAAAADAPERVAIRSARGELTFAELWTRTQAAMADISRRGAGGLGIVATLREDTIIAILAAIELGVPLTLLHPRLTPEERAPLVAIAGVGVVLDETWTAPRDGAALAKELSDDAPLAVLFTSGSTGTPKGVELSRRAFAASAAASAQNLGWRDDDAWLLCMPLAHVGGLSVVLRCLAARRAVVLAPWTGSVKDLAAAISELRPTLLSLVPTMLAKYLDEDARFPSFVRAVLLGGDAASASLLARANGVPVLTTYGMTETCAQIVTLAAGEAASIEKGVGRPLPGVELRTVDGEIFVRSPTLFTRYLTANGEARPFDADGWFATGDLGHVDANGFLHVTGRKNDRIITGGENVDPREVEAALVTIPGVVQACVFGVADETWGQLVAAALVLADGTTSADVAAQVRSQLAAHKRPRLLHRCEALPVNANGKLDRRGIAAAAAGRLEPLR